MTQPQEVLRNYKQLLSGNNSISQPLFSSMVLNGTEVRGGNNLVSKQTRYLRKGLSKAEKSTPLLQINLKTTSRNLVAKTPVYRFNNTLTSNPIEAEPEILYENNKFLYNSGGGFEASYFTTTDSFKPENDNIEDKTLSEVLEEESTKDSREGIAVIRYNYSYFGVGLFTEQGFFGIAGDPNKALIGFRNIYDYTYNIASLEDGDTIIFDNMREKPEDNVTKEIQLNGYTSTYAVPREDALVIYDYHQYIINLLRGKEFKLRNATNFITVACALLEDVATGGSIEFLPPPFIASNPASPLGLDFASHKYANEYTGYSFDIGRVRSYYVEREINKPTYLEIIEFTQANIRPDFIVSFPPYSYSLDNIRIDLSDVEFAFDFLDLSDPNAPTSLLNEDVTVTIDVSAELYYKIDENSTEFIKLKEFAFSFSNGSIEGDFIFGDLFVFDSVYLSYYIVITSFEVSI